MKDQTRHRRPAGGWWAGRPPARNGDRQHVQCIGAMQPVGRLNGAHLVVALMVTSVGPLSRCTSSGVRTAIRPFNRSDTKVNSTSALHAPDVSSQRISKEGGMASSSVPSKQNRQQLR